MRCFLLLVTLGWLAFGAKASAEEGSESSGYGVTEPDYQYEVVYDGYSRVARQLKTAEPRTYAVVETESGTKTEYEGEPIIVVKEPEPVAASSEAPPPPRVEPGDEKVRECASGVWVHGYWDYRGGRYVWVDGHCVAVRVDYVFVAPRWDFYWDIWWFIPGYYRPCGVFVTYGYYRPWHWFPPYPYPYYRTSRPIPEFRGVPARRTVARPLPVSGVPSATRVPRHPTTVIDTPPPESTRAFSLGRSATGTLGTDQGARSRHNVDMVTEPRYNPRPGIGTSRSGRSRGFSAKPSRSRQSPSGSGWQWNSGSSSGSSGGWGGGRSRSTPSSGSSSGSSSGRSGGGFGGKHK
jgi:hypothetical protein